MYFFAVFMKITYIKTVICCAFFFSEDTKKNMPVASI